ncbi:hypothetical protein QPK87_34220 [Kamptonema cortianum]|nr:hypothetical protein [Kamptonema cortianum]
MVWDRIRSDFTVRTLVIVGLVLSPAYAVVHLISRYAVQVPFHDTWTMWLYDYAVVRYMPLHEALNTLWILQNEHRIFLPRLLILPLSHLTHLNLITMMYLSLGVLLILTLVLSRASSRLQLGRYGFVTPLVISVFIFALTASDRYINENAFPVFCAVLFSVLCLYYATASGTRAAFMLSLMFGIMASLSFSSGYVALVLGGTALVLISQPERRWRLLIWMLVSLVLVGFYAGELFPKRAFLGEGSLAFDLRSVGLSALRLLGSPISPVWPVPAAFGLIPLLLFAALSLVNLPRLLRPRDNKFTLFWILLGLWCMATALLAAFGRSEVQGQGTPTRYFIYGQVFQICVIILGVHTAVNVNFADKWRKWGAAAISAAGIIFPAGAYYFAATHFDYHSEFRVEREFLTTGYDCLRRGHLEVTDLDCIRPLFFNTLTVNLLAPYVYRQPIASLTSSGPVAALTDHLPLAEISESASIVQERITVEGGTYQALAFESDHAVRWQISLPEAPALTLRAGLMLPQSSSDAAQSDSAPTYTVLVQHAGAEHILFQLSTSETAAQEIVEFTSDLSEFAGMTVDLIFIAQHIETHARGYWLEPALESTVTDKSPAVLLLPANLVSGTARQIRLPNAYRVYDHANAPMFTFESIEMNGTPQNAAPVRPGERLEWRFHIPIGSEVIFQTDLFLDAPDPTDDQQYVAAVMVQAGINHREIMFQQLLDSSQNMIGIEIDLTPFAGTLPSSPLESIILTLMLDSADERSGSSVNGENAPVSYWIEPRLQQRIPMFEATPADSPYVLIHELSQ